MSLKIFTMEKDQSEQSDLWLPRKQFGRDGFRNERAHNTLFFKFKSFGKVMRFRVLAWQGLESSGPSPAEHGTTTAHLQAALQDLAVLGSMRWIPEQGHGSAKLRQPPLEMG